jgi:hypothetical protein
MTIQYEYAYLRSYVAHSEASLPNPGVDKTAWFFGLETEGGETLLDAVKQLTALNQIGRDGWMVYSTVAMSNYVRPTPSFYTPLADRLGWEVRTVGGGTVFSLRRQIES